MYRIGWVAVLAAITVSGCSGGGSSRPSKIGPADTSRSGAFWIQLDASQKTQLATFCRAQTAVSVGNASHEPVADPVYSQAYSLAQQVDTGLVVHDLDDFYSLAYERDTPIRHECSQVIYRRTGLSADGKLPLTHLDVRAPARTSSPRVKLTGTVTKGATVRVRASRLTAHAGKGWYPAHRARVHGTRFSASVALPTHGENDYRVDATAWQHRRRTIVGDVTRVP